MGKNNVVLIGEDHHNGLGLVRSFGVNGIKPYGIIICKEQKCSYISYSKYWQKVFVVNDEIDAIDVLKKEFIGKKRKTVVMPWSDSIAAYLDCHYSDLRSAFILPSINGQEGRIFELMDKQKQTVLCKNLGLNMLPSKIVPCVIDAIIKAVKEIGLPVILKPVTSIEGEKSDINVCKSYNDLKLVASYMEHRPYKRILLQKYLEQREEYVLTGAVEKDLNVFILVKHIRQWPKKIGCGSLSIFVGRGSAVEYARYVLDKIGQFGYSGNIDVEFFASKQGDFYLNEVNWRSSGRNFVSLYTKVYPAVDYYNYLIKGEKKREYSKKSGFTMNEATDLRHVIKRDLSFRKWLMDMFYTNSFAIWYMRDPLPAIVHYVHLAKEFFKKVVNTR